MALLIIVVLILLVVVGAIIVPAAIWYTRNIQEKKNYERALKLVPLLIHLPPMSEDIETNGRDFFVILLMKIFQKHKLFTTL